ncbi:MAG TPA: TIGR03808 family TAT-translocated repetitive protein [Devosiaceae bacterium]|jgi:uncharacterized secreted repeat protein (TIGR03808 family)|nr:TIGR03808 family TAT-translocated repetitive protein [Devosiaceae bacterium]
MRDPLTRRHVLAGLAAFTASASTLSATASDAVDGAEFGLVPESASDQSAALQAAIDAAAARGGPLQLASGRYSAGGLQLRHNTTISGLRGGVVIEATSAPLFSAAAQNDIVLENLVLRGSNLGGDAPLLSFTACERLHLSGLRLEGGGGSGVNLESSGGRLTNLDISDFEHAGIFAHLSHDLIIRDCRITRCGNGGILVWGDGEAHDGTIVTANQISDIDWRGGGNGQNGNGINVYKANGVMVTNNVIRNCAFTAVRLNASNDTHVIGNSCLDSGEVAIFSEFGFSGSVIADNIVDGAAQGISMTNFDSNGRLAACSGNIVRNITPRSLVNPDTTPAGIFAEADAVITGNVVEAVPGLGIGAGWGPYLRDVVISGNVVRDCEVGIGVSVAEGAGKAVVSGNRVAEARRAGIAAFAWDEMMSEDLQRDAEQFPTVTITGNSVN